MVRVLKKDKILFLKTFLNYCQHYLACGGPSSRLEERITKVGNRLGFLTDVYATPTGFFLTFKENEGAYPITEFCRIEKVKINLMELTRLEKSLEKLLNEKITVAEFNEELSSPIYQREQKYSHFVLLIATFLIGLVSSYYAFLDLKMSFVSGALASVSYVILSPLSSYFKIGTIFSHFASCLIVMIVAYLLNFLLQLPVEPAVLGSFILMVPGFAITNSVSELADQNFLSGTLKMMKALLTLLAMGMAYLLVKELAVSYVDLVWKNSLQYNLNPKSIGLSILCVGTLIASFAVYFHIPIWAIPISLFLGAIGLIVFQVLQADGVLIFPSFVMSLVVGLFSLLLGNLMKVPSQIFSVPGLLSLVPGLLAFSHFENPTQTGFMSVLLISGAIVFGLLTARIPFLLIKKDDFDHRAI